MILWRDPVEDTDTTVTFRVHDPDEVQTLVRLVLPRAAWESQGAPERLTMALSSPVRRTPQEAS